MGFNPDDTLPKTFDLERVEVLRGPQGTLFGAGSEGGTVRYLMAEPNMTKASMYSRSEVSYTQGGTASYEAGVAGGAPIIDNTLGFRASIWYRHDGGWIDRIDPFTLNTVQKDANYENTVVMRVAAKWAINDAWTITPSVIYQDRGRNDISVFWPVVTGANGQKAFPTRAATSTSAQTRRRGRSPTITYCRLSRWKPRSVRRPSYPTLRSLTATI